MASMPTSRRLLRAGLLTLALWLLVGGAIGVASADDGQGASFVMPAVQLGDRVAYEQVGIGDGGTEREELGISWSRRAPLLLDDGRWHEIDSLRYDLGDLAELDETETFDVLFGAGVREHEAGTHLMHALTVHANGTGQEAEGFGLPIPIQTVAFELDLEMTLFLPDDYGDLDVPDCLFGGLWGGQEVTEDGTLRLPECISPAWVLSGMTFHGVGREDVDGVPAFRYHGVHERSSSFATVDGLRRHAEADLWLSPASPYPLRAVVVDQLDGDRETLELRMTGFEPGTQPRVAVEPRDASPEPELRTAPFEGLLPFSDADTDLPFPLSRAVESSRSDPDVALFLADHPQAYVAAAFYNEVTTAGQPQRGWEFVLADHGSQGLRVIVLQEQPGGDGVPSPLAPLLRVDHVDSVEQTEGNAPKRSDLARELPTMGSLIQRWAWHRGVDGPGDGGFGGYDLRSGAGISDATFAGGHLVMAGRLGATTTPTVGTGGAVLTTDADIDFAAYDLEGNLWLLLGGRSNEQEVLGTGTATPPGSSGMAPLTSAVAPASWVPTPAQAAGAGIVALVVGAFYFLWPKLKALAFAGLFTRLLPSKLLDHPGRARLLEVIRAEPGIHFQELVRRSGLASGTAVHHLNKLARADLIACRPLGRYTCYFPGASPDRQSLLAAPLLRSDGARLVYETILGSPHLSGLELAERTGLQKSTVNYHVQRLTEAGLVAAQRDGRAVRLRAVPGAMGAAGAAASA